MGVARASACSATMTFTLAISQAYGAVPTTSQVAAAADVEPRAVLTIVPMSLPQTGIEAYAAKVLTAQGAVEIVTLGGDGSVLSHDRLVANEEAARASKFGKLTPRLSRELQTGQPKTALPVNVWANAEIRYPPKDALLKDSSALAAHQAEVRLALARAVEPILAWMNGHALTTPGMTRSSDILSPSISATVDSRHIAELAALDSVAWIDLDEAGKPASTVWYTNTSVSLARSLTTGSGITSCIVESDRPVDATYLNVSSTASVGGCTDTHAQAVAGIISNTYTGNTTSITSGSVQIANWDQFNFNSTYPSMWAWCNAQGARVDNFSWTMAAGTEPNFGSTDAQIDWYAKNYPYPLIVTSAGNEAGYCQNKNRNGLVVGASDDKGTGGVSDDTIASTSSWRNPSTTHGDLEMPALVAPGVGIDSANLASMNGTSFSTAQVTGAAMLLFGRDSNLAGWPEESRAVLMATAVANVDDNAFSNLPASDMKDGVGRLNTYNAALLADSANSVGTNNTARANGRSHISMSLANDFTGGIYNGTWAIQAAAAGNMRVVATWDATPTCSGSGGTSCTESLDADLDLLIYNSAGALVCSSTSFDSSWEGCDFSVAAGSTYTVKISQASRNQTDTYFGLAWFSH